MLYALLFSLSSLVSVSTLKCPSCWKVHDTSVCSQNSQICEAADNVCLGKLEEWKFSVTCSVSLLCPINDLFSGTVNCTGGVAFRPHDECSACCTGPDCDVMLRAVQRGFAAIPTVLHCPTCSKTSNPRDCMNNILPCDATHDTCEIEKQDGLYSGNCKTSHTCHFHQNNHPDFPACFQDQNGGCTICCHDGTCIRQAYGILMATPPTTALTNTTLQTTELPTTTPNPDSCTDSPLHPCSIKNDSCDDPFTAMFFCQRTCNMCPGQQMTSSTLHSSMTSPARIITSSVHSAISSVQTTTSAIHSTAPSLSMTTSSASCVDSDEFQCEKFKDICHDQVLAKLHCPRMCNLCP